MPWDANRVNALWITESRALGDPRLNYLKKYVAGFAAIARLVEEAGTMLDDGDVALAMCNCNQRDDPNYIRRTFISELEDLGPVPPAAQTVPFTAGAIVPTPPAPPHTVPPEIQARRQRVKAMRTLHQRRRGESLATTARSLLGSWRWTERAPDSILPYRYARTNTSGYTDINGFDRWLQGGGPPPSGTTALNCRDAVLVTACMAGLLGPGQIRAVYMLAEKQARHTLGDVALAMQRADSSSWTTPQQQTGSNAYVAYLRVIDDQLTRYRDAFPVDLRHGLIPHPGDLVFVTGNSRDLPPNHVCLSLGRRWINGTPVDEVASLWHHDNGKFTRAGLGDMASYVTELTFMPCPF